jgi:heat shock protein HslJ
MRYALIVLGLSLAACGKGGTADSGGPDPESIPRASERQLTGVEWILMELNGTTPPAGAGGRPASLTFAEGGRVSGFGGCNRMTGAYDVSGERLRIGPMASTRMACEQGMDLEQSYGAALEATQRYRLTSDGLELLGGDGVIARYRRVGDGGGE